MIFLSIGSNLSSPFGGRFENINKCISLLLSNKVKPLQVSNFYESISYPDKKNPKFINIILIIKFNGTPNSLLGIISFIEKKMGRIRTKKNEPRIIDIDIIDYDKIIMNTEKITLPHPNLVKRNFVLLPLREICSDWKHPITNKKIDFYIKKLNFNSSNEITRINESAILE